jgi:hypothetical protein
MVDAWVGVPGRCRWYPQPLQNAADRRRPHAVAELAQFALNSLVSPAEVLPGQALDQHHHSVIDAWTTNASGIGPLFGHQATMPAQDRAQRDQSRNSQHRGQSSDERGNTARSAQSIRGLGLVVRNTATS